MDRSLRLGRFWAPLVALALTAVSASAQTTYTWTGAGSDANWSTAGNWTASAGSPPPADDLNNTILLFSSPSATQLNNNLNYSFSANALNFDANSAQFVLVGTNTLTIGSGGLTNTSNNIQTINFNMALGANSTWVNNGTGSNTGMSIFGNVNNNGFLLTVGGSNSTAYFGVISGAGGLTMNGSATVRLQGLNTYTGDTTISAGTLLPVVNNALPSASAVILADSVAAKLDLNNTVQSIRSLAGGAGSATTAGIVATGSSGNGFLTINGTSNTTFSGLFTGAGTVAVTNAGKLTLRGNSTWTGPLNVSGGAVVSIDNATRLGPLATADGQITLDNGTIEQTNPGSGAGTFTPALRNITLGAGGGTLSFTNSGAGNQSIVQTGTVISGPGGLTKDGAGIIAVSTAATYTGPTHVVAGTLRVRTSSNIFPISTALTVDSGATFELNANLNQQVGSLSGAGVVSILGGTFTVGDTTSTTFTGVFTNSANTGKVVKVGSGMLTVTGASSYVGSTKISGGILSTNLLDNGGNASGIGQSTSIAGNLILDGGTLQYTGAAVSTDRLFTLNATGGTIDASGTGALLLSGTGNIAGSGVRTLTLTGTNTGANTLTPNLTGATTGLTKEGVGTWVLAGANTYSGATTVNNGTLAAGAANSFSATSAVTLANTSGVVMDLAGFNQAIGSLSGGGATGGNVTLGSATLTAGGDNTSTSYAGVISGTGGLTKAGTGTFTLTGTNTYTGPTTVNAGTLVLGTGGSLASGSAVTVGSGNVLAGTGTVGGTVAVSTGGAIRGDVTGGIGTLTVNNDVTIANNGTLRTEVSRTGTNTANASLLAITGAGVLNLAPTAGDKFFIDIINNATNPMTAGETYTITLATVASGTINVNGVAASGVIDPSNYTLFSGMTSADNVSLVASGGNLTLTFSPVPEPATVLGLAAGVLGLGGLVRRRMRATQAV